MTANDVHQMAAAVAAAAERLREHVLATPLLPSPWLSQELNADVRLKLENVQLGGSFKIRGATNALLCLDEDRRRRGVVAASSGNHGLCLALAGKRLAVPTKVYVPKTTPPAKRAAIEALGAAVTVHGDDCVETERHARATAAERGWSYVSPYNDADVIAGQGTVMREIATAWPQVDSVYIALGGGGLMAGMASWAQAHAPAAAMVGCSPAQSPAFAECLRQGQIVEVACGDTWSDSTAGGVEEGAITLDLCRGLVHTLVDVEEDAIAAAMRDALAHQHLLLEGAAGVAIAACRQHVARVDADGEGAGKESSPRPRRIAIVACGGNLPYELLQRLIAT
ncbi:MAG: pyridoxal-phosphate dependent enzyme [Planctomycetota bacterium]